MSKFKVGDLVVCVNPVSTMTHYLNVRARITEISGHGKFLQLSNPYERNGVYTAAQFKKCNQFLENK